MPTLYGKKLKAEETFIRQKSGIKWLADGDQNTSFFDLSHECSS